MTPSKEAAEQAMAKAQAAEQQTLNDTGPGIPRHSIEAILQVTIYSDYTDTELKFSSVPMGFDRLANEFLVMHKHFAQLHAEGQVTHDFPPDNKSVTNIALTPDEETR